MWLYLFKITECIQIIQRCIFKIKTQNYFSKSFIPFLFFTEGSESISHSSDMKAFFFSDFYFIYLFFYFTIFYWFCHTSTWIRHGCTSIHHPEPLSYFPPHTIPLGHPSAPAPSILYPALNLDWRFVSYMILYMFQCHSLKSSHPRPLPSQVLKTGMCRKK